MNDVFLQLNTVCLGRVKQQELMSKHTNFRIGGAAEYFVDVKNEEELMGVMKIAQDHNLKKTILGGGSNILVADEGIQGIVIKIAFRSISIDKNCIQADAGVPMILLSRKSGDVGLSGFEWAITLPGTVGGAVRGNAGCFGGETKDHLVSARLFDGKEIVTVNASDLAFGYRDSRIKRTAEIVLSAQFQFAQGNKEEIQERMKICLEKRKQSQPIDGGSAGCLFKNVEISSDDELQRIQTKLDLPSEMSNGRRISAGWLIDQLDLKGFQIGGAKISEKHGNFVLNMGGATSDHVVQLIALIKTRARDHYGILMKEEVQYCGFEKN